MAEEQSSGRIWRRNGPVPAPTHCPHAPLKAPTSTLPAWTLCLGVALVILAWGGMSRGSGVQPGSEEACPHCRTPKVWGPQARSRLFRCPPWAGRAWPRSGWTLWRAGAPPAGPVAPVPPSPRPRGLGARGAQRPGQGASLRWMDASARESGPSPPPPAPACPVLRGWPGRVAGSGQPRARGCLSTPQTQPPLRPAWQGPGKRGWDFDPQAADKLTSTLFQRWLSRQETVLCPGGGPEETQPCCGLSSWLLTPSPGGRGAIWLSAREDGYGVCVPMARGPGYTIGGVTGCWGDGPAMSVCPLP